MRKAFIILACEVVVLGAVVVAFLLSESPGVRTPTTFAAVAAPRPARSVAVSINLAASTGRTATTALRARGGGAIVVTKR